MNTTKEKTAVLFADINDDLLNLVFRKGLAFTREDFNSGFGKTLKAIESLGELKENCTLEDFDVKVKENQLKIEGVWCSTLNSILEEYNLEAKVLGPDYIRDRIFIKSVDLLAFILNLPRISQLMDLIELYQIIDKGEGSIHPEVIKMTLLLSIYMVHVGFVNTSHTEELFDKEGNEIEEKKERIDELIMKLVDTLSNLSIFLGKHLCSHFQSLSR